MTNNEDNNSIEREKEISKAYNSLYKYSPSDIVDKQFLVTVPIEQTTLYVLNIIAEKMGGFPGKILEILPIYLWMLSKHNQDKDYLNARFMFILLDNGAILKSGNKIIMSDTTEKIAIKFDMYPLFAEWLTEYGIIVCEHNGKPVEYISDMILALESLSND